MSVEDILYHIWTCFLLMVLPIVAQFWLMTYPDTTTFMQGVPE